MSVLRHQPRCHFFGSEKAETGDLYYFFVVRGRCMVLSFESHLSFGNQRSVIEQNGRMSNKLYTDKAASMVDEIF